MKKLLFTIFLTIFSTGAMAEWIQIGISTDKTITVYFDKASIEKKGSIVKMWSMIDYSSPQESDTGTILSSVNLFAYDCSKKMSKCLQTTNYSENMMKGIVVISEENNKYKWSYIVPSSIDEGVWRRACGKK